MKGLRNIITLPTPDSPPGMWFMKQSSSSIPNSKSLFFGCDMKLYFRCRFLKEGIADDVEATVCSTVYPSLHSLRCSKWIRGINGIQATKRQPIPLSRARRGGSGSDVCGVSDPSWVPWHSGSPQMTVNTPSCICNIFPIVCSPLCCIHFFFPVLALPCTRTYFLSFSSSFFYILLLRQQILRTRPNIPAFFICLRSYTFFLCHNVVEIIDINRNRSVYYVVTSCASVKKDISFDSVPLNSNRCLIFFH